MNTTSTNILSQLKATPYYMVYRKIIINAQYPDGVWQLHTATEIEPNDTFKCPLTRPQACVYADITPAALKRLVKSGFLKEHKLLGYNGAVFVHEEIERAKEMHAMYN
ncbi:hypothetical protein [Pontibacter litorisediminis]|uniref:hypothetical protein n=1 Tax=Pontibacter litorisediminis TaxID=1846260 RepID=UPI0023EB04C2|nr:hypothetical protein [Pontibacter litorisediminis]